MIDRFLDKPVCGLHWCSWLDKSIKICPVLVHNGFKIGADLVVIDDVLVEVIQPCHFIIQGFGNLTGGFQVIDLLLQLSLHIVIGKNLQILLQ